MKLKKRTGPDSVSSGYGRTISDTSTTDYLKYPCAVFDLCYSWLKSIEVDRVLVSYEEQEF